jgi:hypothetical protein
VLLVEDPATRDWLEPALNTLRASTSPDISLTVLAGRRGAIERTSSGKPRRRVLWQRLLRGEVAEWTPVHATGTSPIPSGTDTPQPDADAAGQGGTP